MALSEMNRREIVSRVLAFGMHVRMCVCACAGLCKRLSATADLSPRADFQDVCKRLPLQCHCHFQQKQLTAVLCSGIVESGSVATALAVGTGIVTVATSG